MVSDDPTAPQPLDAEQVAALGRDWRTMPTERARDVLALVATVKKLRTEVDRLTADLATTTSQRDAALDFIAGKWATTRSDALDIALRRARAVQPQEGRD